MHHFLAKLFGKHQRRAARSDYRKSYQARLTVERLEERALMALVVPAYHSLLNAPATLYLDFDGNTESTWQDHFFDGSVRTFDHMKDGRSGIITPAFDLDGTPTDFSGPELEAIQKIWKRVAEDYAPFNIDVTTVNPGSFNNKQALHVVIGGSAFDWFQDKTDSEARDATSGWSSPGSFTDAMPNVVFAFSGTIREKANTPWKVGTTNKFQTDGDGRRVQIISAVANTISHEAGHTFGLWHQSTFNADGTGKQEYNPGDANWTPIMGDNLASDRTTWSNGMTENGTQDDMAVIVSAANGISKRPDELDYRTLAVQSPYTVQATSGVISTTADKDLYQFNSAGGWTQISVRVAAEGPNLDATLQILKINPYPWLGPYATQIGYVDATPTATDQGLNASYYASLSPGLYYVIVGSHGTYGDVGQYTVAVTSGLYQIAQIAPYGGASYYGGGSSGSGASYYGGGSVGSGGTTGGASAQMATTVQDQATSAPRSTARTAAAPAARRGTSLDDHTRALLAWTAQRGHLPLDAAFARLSAHSSHRLGQQ